MIKNCQKNKGIFFTVIGSLLFLLFVGKFLLQIIGAIVAIYLINYGLSLQHLPSIWILMQKWFIQLKQGY